MDIKKVLFSLGDYTPFVNIFTNNYAISKIEQIKKHSFNSPNDFTDFELFVGDRTLSRCKWARIPIIGNIYALFDDIHIFAQTLFIRFKPETLKTKSFEFQKAFLRDQKTREAYLKYADQSVIDHFISTEKRTSDINFVNGNNGSNQNSNTSNPTEQTERLHALKQFSKIETKVELETFTKHWNQTSPEIQKKYLSSAKIKIIEKLLAENIIKGSDLEEGTLLILIQGDTDSGIQPHFELLQFASKELQIRIYHHQKNSELFKFLSKELQVKLFAQHKNLRKFASKEAILLYWTEMPKSLDQNLRFFETQFETLKPSNQNSLMQNAPENFEKLSMAKQKEFINATSHDVRLALITFDAKYYDFLSKANKNVFLQKHEKLPNSLLDKTFNELLACANKKQFIPQKALHKNLQRNLFRRAAEVILDPENKATIAGRDRPTSKTIAENFMKQAISTASVDVQNHVKQTYPQFFQANTGNQTK